MTSKIMIHGHHLDITDAMRDHLMSHLGRALKHFDQLQRVSVNMRIEKLIHHVEVTVHMPHKDTHTQAQAGNMYAAIDEVCLKLDRQVLKHKERVRDHHKQMLQHEQDIRLAA